MKIIQIYHDINVINARRRKKEKEEKREREREGGKKEKEKMCRRMMMQGIGKNDYNTSNSPKFDDHRKDKTSEKKSRENKKKYNKNMDGERKVTVYHKKENGEMN